MTIVSSTNPPRRHRPSFGRPLAIRGFDDFDTPPIALRPLFEHEPLLAGVTSIAEPFCGQGNLVLPLRARGLTVHASDIRDRGCPDSFVRDFFEMTKPPADCHLLLSNPPFSRAMDMIEHAFAIGFDIVIFLLKVGFLCTADRFERLHKPGHLRRVYTLAERLQDMHDANFTGEKASQSQVHMWAVLDRSYCGPATINPVSIYKPSECPWKPCDAADFDPIADVRASDSRAVAPPSGSRRKSEQLDLTEMHSPFGGSVAARVLRCPASVRLVGQVPAALRKTSAYAERGTALHIAMARLLDGENARSLDNLVGKTISNYTITRDDVENALRPAFNYVDALLETPGATFYLEHRVSFLSIAGAFGTVDLLVRIGDTIHVIDFKFGVGVRVLALRPDGDDDVINAQLLFYAAAARHSHPEFFAGVKHIVLTIAQPMSVEPDAEMVSSVEVTHAELDEFLAVYRNACAEALSQTPRLARGDWCRFCAARPICPSHTAPLLDLADFMLPTPATAPSKEAYLQLLADGLTLVDAIKDIRTALHDQAMRALQSGDVVPGYALSAGRAERHWRDENAATAALLHLGLTRGDVVAEAMRSPKQVELRAKARGLKVPPELIDSHRSGVALVRSENAHAPVRGRGEIVRSFSAALESFQRKESRS